MYYAIGVVNTGFRGGKEALMVADRLAGDNGWWINNQHHHALRDRTWRHVLFRCEPADQFATVLDPQKLGDKAELLDEILPRLDPDVFADAIARAKAIGSAEML